MRRADPPQPRRPEQPELRMMDRSCPQPSCFLSTGLRSTPLRALSSLQGPQMRVKLNPTEQDQGC